VARYGQAYKDRIVARLLPPESSSVEHVSREVGISVATLERWRANGLADGSGAGRPRWTAAARLQAVIVTAAMDETMRNAWCREQGLFRRSWMPGSAIAGLGEPRAASAAEARQDRRRVKESERKLHRKDKHWPRRPPCSCCQKNSQRHSWKRFQHQYARAMRWIHWVASTPEIHQQATMCYT
jgi:transposase